MKPPRQDRIVERYYRHFFPVRVMHWINVVALAVLLMSGLGIFNAHPSLAWGKSSYNGRPSVLEIDWDNNRRILTIFGHQFDATGILGVSKNAGGTLNRHAFPSWITLPGSYSLADSRSWHFLFAWLFVLNGISYVGYAFFSGHVKRDLKPNRAELQNIGTSIKDHLLLRHAQGDEAKHYNVLQKLAYLTVIFVLLPLIILMGMAMSPALDSLLPGWVNLVGGRQSARTIHFIVAWLLVAFVLIHVFEVIITGLWNNLRSMITGYYAVEHVSQQNASEGERQ